MGKVKRKASGKTEKTKSTNQRKRRKVVATNKERGQEPNVQPADERDPKQTVVAAMKSLGQALFSSLNLIVFQLQLNRNVFHRNDGAKQHNFRCKQNMQMLAI